jgi:hypothetical protein
VNAPQKLCEQFFRFHYGPDWRWRVAGLAATDTLPLALLESDTQIQRAVEYLALRAERSSGEFFRQHQQALIHAAVGLWDRAALAAILKVLVLGGCKRANIAARLGQAEEVIDTTEALFFDVRGQLDATDWIVSEVIAAELREGDPGLAVQMKLALFGGPIMAEAVVDTPERIPLLEADRLVDQSTLLHLKLEEALAVPLRSEANLLQFFKLYFNGSSAEFVGDS